jgi:hypothetical protein
MLVYKARLGPYLTRAPSKQQRLHYTPHRHTTPRPYTHITKMPTQYNVSNKIGDHRLNSSRERRLIRATGYPQARGLARGLREGQEGCRVQGRQDHTRVQADQGLHVRSHCLRHVSLCDHKLMPGQC